MEDILHMGVRVDDGQGGYVYISFRPQINKLDDYFWAVIPPFSKQGEVNIYNSVSFGTFNLGRIKQTPCEDAQLIKIAKNMRASAEKGKSFRYNFVLYNCWSFIANLMATQEMENWMNSLKLPKAGQP